MDGEASSFDGGSILDTCSGSSPVFGRVLFGVWLDQEKLLHISLLEMKALSLALQSFREDVIGHHVIAMCDNSTVVAYVNKQGGPMLVDQSRSEMDGESRHLSRCEVSSRTSQCLGRSPQPSLASCRDRVVFSPSDGEVTASILG